MPGATDFDRALERVVAIERVSDLGIGRALRRLKEGRRYQRLGFVLWRDYVREGLGIELRWAQEIEKLDRACEKVPELGEALASGELVMSKVLDLFQVVGEGTEVEERREWIERARGLSVRGSRREIGEWKVCAAADALPEGERPVDPAEIPAGRWIQFRVPYPSSGSEARGGGAGAAAEQQRSAAVSMYGAHRGRSIQRDGMAGGCESG